MNVSDMKEWLELCEHLGTGATFILGIWCWMLCRERKEDKAYMRTSDRQNMEILGRVTGLLETGNLQHAASKNEILKAVEFARDRILDNLSGLKR